MKINPIINNSKIDFLNQSFARNLRNGKGKTWLKTIFTPDGFQKVNPEGKRIIRTFVDQFKNYEHIYNFLTNIIR